MARRVTGFAWCFGVVAFTAGGAHAESKYDACMNGASSTVAMQDCQMAALAEVDTRLNAAYRKAIDALPVDQQEKLRKSERLWITFRDADCGVFYGNDTGTMATIQGGGCMIERSEQRIQNLAAFSNQ